MVKGKRIEIRTVDDLLRAADTSRDEHESLILAGDKDECLVEIPSRPHESGAVTEAQVERALAVAGAWKGLVNTEQLKRDIYSSRGRTPRPAK